MMRKFIFTLLLVSLSFASWAGERGFAIFVDKGTFNVCQTELKAYESMLRAEGFTTFLLPDDWETPEQVKAQIVKLYEHDNLEGAVFVGQIPVPMIRDAQHFTSAFKMDQKKFPMFDSSVPSDRFYDDFDLKFDFIAKDSLKSLFYYYSLRWDSPQRISCDIYTGRVKPTRSGEEGYRQISDYFNKLMAERNSSNEMNVLVSYTGEGSFSNSLTAWKEEGVTLREQFPQAFHDRNSAKSLLFCMYPYMKDIVIDEMQRNDVDLMFFHEHGTPDRQYLTAMPKADALDLYPEAAKYLFRERLRKLQKENKDLSEFKKNWMRYYNIDSTWFAGAFDPKQIVEDSLQDIRTGIVLADVPKIKPNPRVVIFDACYNGDFREDDYIAGEYIFSPGKTVVCIGNTVNVLQDKSSSDLLGLLGLGYSIGEWAQQTNILESHIIGDPTFIFKKTVITTKEPFSGRADLRSKDTLYWLNFFNNVSHPDLKGLALHKLFELNYRQMSDLLLKTYQTSPYYMLRLQVYHLLQFYIDGNFEKMLMQAVTDPYEFIRRKAVYSMGRIGKDEFIPYIASVYVNDFLDERIEFNAISCLDLMNLDKMENEVLKQLNESNWLFDKEKKIADFKNVMASRRRMAEYSLDLANKNLKLKSRQMGVSMLRNNPYHQLVDDYLRILADKDESVELRTDLAEALGWFTLSYRKSDIVSACRILAAESGVNPVLRAELLKTANRLEVYMR
jgi:hypothetical protein